jgi:hypothetical protein
VSRAWFRAVRRDTRKGCRYWFPLEQIAHLLEENLSLEQLRGMFTLKQAQTQQLIDTEQSRLARIAARLSYIEQVGKMPTEEMNPNHNVTEVQFPVGKQAG